MVATYKVEVTHGTSSTPPSGGPWAIVKDRTANWLWVLLQGVNSACSLATLYMHVYKGPKFSKIPRNFGLPLEIMVLPLTPGEVLLCWACPLSPGPVTERNKLSAT